MSQQATAKESKLFEPADHETAADILDYLKRISGYPYKTSVDPPFVEELIEDFLEINLLEEIKAADPKGMVHNIRSRWLFSGSDLA